MEMVSSGYIHPLKSIITMLPLSDLNSSNENYIYSTLLHVIGQARQIGIVTPSVTFDQPLWIKAVEIVISKDLNVVGRLSGFHSLMSFVGSLGMVMEGSGLEKLLETTYGKASVPHDLWESNSKSPPRSLSNRFCSEN